jgi:hypothetical protein
MASRRPGPHRLLLPILLAGALAAEITGLAIARSIVPASTVSSPSGGAAFPSTPTIGPLGDDIARVMPPVVNRDVADAARDPRTLLAAIAHNRPTPVAGPGTSPPSPVRSSQATVGGDSSGSRSVMPPSSAPSYRGRNHVWVPSLGINRSVSSFPCSRTRPPDNYVYRWGCAGRNNVYLLGHAYSVFKPLHDAYTSGRLRKGMKVVYADGAGRVHAFAVIWWRVVAPTTAASWAWAAQSRPSMTLQTCVGANSAYRLMVRLVQVG